MQAMDSDWLAVAHRCLAPQHGVQTWKNAVATGRYQLVADEALEHSLHAHSLRPAKTCACKRWTATGLLLPIDVWHLNMVCRPGKMQWPQDATSWWLTRHSNTHCTPIHCVQPKLVHASDGQRLACCCPSMSGTSTWCADLEKCSGHRTLPAGG